MNRNVNSSKKNNEIIIEDENNNILDECTIFSVGGGTIKEENERV